MRPNSKLAGYNAIICITGELMKPGKTAQYPSNIFNTWLDFNAANGIVQADLIRSVNAKLGKQYDNKTFHNWRKQLRTLPDVVINECITPDLPAVFEWYLDSHDRSNLDCNELAAAFSPCVKLNLSEAENDH